MCALYLSGFLSSCHATPSSLLLPFLTETFIPALHSHLFFSCFHHPHLSCLPDFPSYAVSGFSYGFIKKQQQTDLHRWVFWEKVSVLTCIHQCHRSQLVSPCQHPDITAGVTNGCDTLVPFLTALSLCSRAFLAATFSEIQWVSLTATAVNIYF